MVDHFVDHIFEVDHFMERYLKFKHQMEANVAPYRAVYKVMKKNAKHPKITSSFTKSVSPSTMHSLSFDHLDNFKPKISASSQ
jgi:hypothetical protein